MKFDAPALAMGLAFSFMWSSAFTSARFAVIDAPPFLFLTTRFLVSGLLAIGLAFAMGQRIALDRRGWLAVFLFGIFQNAVYLGFNFVAIQWIDASVAVIIASLLPLVVAALSWALFREQLRPMALLGLGAGVVGVLMVMSARLGGGADPVGVALCFGGVLALSAATLLVRGFSAGGNLLMIVGLQMLVGSALLLPVAWFSETWTVNWTLPLGIAFLYTTLIPGLLATFVWFKLVERIGATRAAAFHFLNPFLGVAVASLLLREHLGPRDMLGVAVIMGGILAVQLSRQAKPLLTQA